MPASTATSPTPETTVKLLERLAYQINITVHSHHAEPIHDLRVAIRRFQQGLALFKCHFRGREIKKIKRRLKELMDLSSAVRDCDIAIKVLTKSGLTSAAALKTKMAQRRKEELALLVAALRRWGSRNTSAKWRAALSSNGQTHDEAARLPKMAKQFLDDGDDAVQEKWSAEELHTYRIDAKKFRYMLELFQPAFGATVKGWLERLKKVQSLLGDIHDYHAVRVTVEDLSADADLEAWLKKKQRKRTREFRDLWKEVFSDAAARHQWIAELRRTPRKPMARSTASRRSSAAISA